ncbi:RNI-like protein [Panaeolus papilionaceus]|nr:RNI-like protein [Panaeolus papilionaceus]
MFSVKGVKKPPVGSFENCASCEKQFTVTRYTMAASSGNGFLCHPCAKSGGKDPFKKPALPKKKRNNADKRTVTSFEERRFPSLVSLCIQLITKHIDDIDALGDIGTMNMEAISKALSKNRGLTVENAHLFYSPGNSSLTLFDATNLPPPALETLAYHNANLVSLRLDFCGQLNDASMQVFSTSLPHLRRIELLGPFLVRVPAWQTFFESHSQLESFLITQSPRFDEDCVRSMVKNCPNIKELRLKEVGKLNDVFLEELQKLTADLTYLDLSDPSHSCSEEAMIALISAVGGDLTYLNLSKHTLLGDSFLMQGVLPNIFKLRHLVLSYLPELTDKGVAEFFNEWGNNPPLDFLDISRNEELQSEALKAILYHSGKNLQVLNINGLKDVEQEALGLIGSVQKDNPKNRFVGLADIIGGQLKKLDVGWCRSVDDFIIKQMLEGTRNKRGNLEGGCKQLEELKVWGCNRVSASCPRRRGLIVLGIETHQVR